MIRLLIALFFISICISCFSQKTKSKIRKNLEKYGKKENLKKIIQETDSTLTLLLRDSTKRPMDVIFHFDGSGKSDRETTIFNCDSCFKKSLTTIFDNKNYKWMKINDTFYVAPFWGHEILEINSEPKFSYTIKRINLNRKEYASLLNSK